MLGLSIIAGLPLGADAALQLMDTPPDAGHVHDKGQEDYSLLSEWHSWAPFPAMCLVLLTSIDGIFVQAGRVTWEALTLAALLGLSITIGLHFGADAALQLMGAPPDAGQMHDRAQEYLQVRALAAPAVLLTTVGQGAFRYQCRVCIDSAAKLHHTVL